MRLPAAEGRGESSLSERNERAEVMEAMEGALRLLTAEASSLKDAARRAGALPEWLPGDGETALVGGLESARGQPLESARGLATLPSSRGPRPPDSARSRGAAPTLVARDVRA